MHSHSFVISMRRPAISLRRTANARFVLRLECRIKPANAILVPMMAIVSWVISSRRRLARARDAVL